jgi:hypothetical protein
MKSKGSAASSITIRSAKATGCGNKTGSISHFPKQQKVMQNAQKGKEGAEVP